MAQSTVLRECVTCGKPAADRRKYCGDACMYARPTKPREPWDYRRARAERNGTRRTCPCGQQFVYVKRLREQYCSLSCANRFALRSGARCEWRCEVPWKSCPVCSIVFVGKYTKLCSDACRRELARRKAKDRWIPVELTNPSVAHVCPECGANFISRRYSAVRKFCTERCSTRAQKRYRRHLLRSRPHEIVGTWEIGERDGWVCQLCRRPIDRTLGFRHRMGKSLDHIIPVAGGGCHLRTNLQIAHRLCNSLKGTGSAQLRIFLEAA